MLKTEMRCLKARLHRRFLSQQLDAIFVAAKSHLVSNMFETPAILKLQLLARQKLHRVAATKIACVNGPLDSDCVGCIK